MTEQKVGNLMETIVTKSDHVWGDEVEITQGKKHLGTGRIIWIISSGTVLMRVVIEIIKWTGR